MPTNLGNLPSNETIPSPRVQIKRGLIDAATEAHPANIGAWLSDGAGGSMTISYTPRYPCYWIVRSNVMVHGIAGPQVWRRWDHGIWITPNDADGVDQGFRCPHQAYDNTGPAGAIEWRTGAGSATFRLSAGIAYTALLRFDGLNPPYGVRYHTGPLWLRLVGQVIGEGVL